MEQQKRKWSLSSIWLDPQRDSKKAIPIISSSLIISSGGSRRGPPLFLDQTEARRVEQKCFGVRGGPPPQLCKGLGDRAPLLSQGLDPALVSLPSSIICLWLHIRNCY